MPDWNKYKRKNKIVEAFVYKGGYVHGIIEDVNNVPMISVPSGDQPINKGDYVVKEGKGDYKAIPASEFEKEYEKIKEKTNSAEPIKCPCCGEEASIVKKDAETGNRVQFYVRCVNKDCRLRTKSCGSQTEAVSIWNKRTQ